MIRENVKINYPFVAVCSSRRSKMAVGWAVYKYTRRGVYLDKTKNPKTYFGVYLDKTKNPKTYFGVSTDFAKATANIRNWYGINLPTGGWSDKTQVNVKRFTTMEDFLINLKQTI